MSYIKWDLGPLDEFCFEIAENQGGCPELQEMYQEWAKIYSEWIHAKFVRNSKGGGDWPQTGKSSKARELYVGKRGRYKGREKGKRFNASILVETGALRDALLLGHEGNLCEIDDEGVAFGLSDEIHPSERITYRALCGLHESNGFQIIHEVDDETLERMKIALVRAIRKLGYRVSRKAQSALTESGDVINETLEF